ncbi:MAG: hypothetical protein N3G77_07730 [Nitrososphaeria archaeon]|nr:hypothetical protein [Nitrososphaeria archaeon]
MALQLSEVLNYAVRIGVQARLENLTKTQIENLLSSLDFINDPRLSLLVTSAYAHRQAARLDRGRATAKLVNELMDKIYRGGEDKEKARFALGLAKWIYEIMEQYRLPRIDISTLTFEKFLELLRGERQ